MHIGQRVAAGGMLVSGALAVLKIAAGIAGHSTAVVADGLESTADIFASGFVLLGLTLAAKPPDHDHPYGHGRVEILAGLLIGLGLAAGGALISYGALREFGRLPTPLAAYVIWPLAVSAAAKTGMALTKFRIGRRLGSAALTADAWNDAVDVLSALVAFIAVALALADPARFHNADRYGGFAVGLIVVFTGVRVAYGASMQLMDTMPDDRLIREIRRAAAAVPGVRGVEKVYARKTGLHYHVDLHLEVDPEMSVRRSHQLAHEVRLHVMDTLNWVADVLVHVEPAR
jgi:cation diffusion facilitator family transporter